MPLARAANAVSAPVDAFFALYEDPVPPPVLRLDSLGREVVLDARDGDFGAASGHVDQFSTTFGQVRDALIADGGEAESTAFINDINSMRDDITAADATKLATDANDALEVVDGMEGVFAKAAAAEREDEDD